MTDTAAAPPTSAATATDRVRATAVLLTAVGQAVVGGLGGGRGPAVTTAALVAALVVVIAVLVRLARSSRPLDAAFG